MKQDALCSTRPDVDGQGRSIAKGWAQKVKENAHEHQSAEDGQARIACGCGRTTIKGQGPTGAAS